MIEVRLTDEFADWLHGLRDHVAKARIVMRLRRFEDGNLGDVKPVGEGVSEARVPVGKGYRLYFVQRGDVLIIMLCGGHKGSQQSDIARAKRMAKEA